MPQPLAARALAAALTTALLGTSVATPSAPPSAAPAAQAAAQPGAPIAIQPVVRLPAITSRLRRPGAPAIAIDMGTATTVDLIGADGAFEGGAIVAGPTLALPSKT